MSINFSLLHRQSTNHDMEISTVKADDIGLTNVCDLLSEVDKEFRVLSGMLTKLPIDGECIRYRQDIFEDIKCNNRLSGHINKWIDEVVELEEMMNVKERKPDYRRQLQWKMAITVKYMRCVEGLSEIMDDNSLKSEGLKTLHGLLKDLQEQQSYQSLKKRVNDPNSNVENLTGMTIQIDFDSKLQPERACLIDFDNNGENHLKEDKKPFIKLRNSNQTESRDYISANDDRIGSFFISNLQPIVTQCLQHICEAYDRYLSEHAGFITKIAFQLYFYTIAVRMVETFERIGLNMCRPAIGTGNIHRMEGLYDILTGLQLHKNERVKDLVTNDIDFTDPKRIFILTGPNQGGKTTFLRAIGLAQVFFQAGLYVPAQHAEMSPVRNIYTHYPKTERKLIGEGRLGEELREISEILKCISKDSLFLMNESISSTSAYDSYVISKNIVKSLKQIGPRVVFATHIHELSYETDIMNNEPDSVYLVVPLSAGVVKTRDSKGEAGYKRTYVIQEGKSDGHSYARDIALQHGMTYEQMKSRL